MVPSCNQAIYHTVHCIVISSMSLSPAEKVIHFIMHLQWILHLDFKIKKQIFWHWFKMDRKPQRKTKVSCDFFVFSRPLNVVWFKSSASLPIGKSFCWALQNSDLRKQRLHLKFSSWIFIVGIHSFENIKGSRCSIKMSNPDFTKWLGTSKQVTLLKAFHLYHYFPFLYYV